MIIGIETLKALLTEDFEPGTEESPAILTLGHSCPDTDAWVSSLAAALLYRAAGKRAWVLKPDALPMPRETAFLLGEALSEAAEKLPAPDSPRVMSALTCHRAVLHLTDHADRGALNPFVTGITDHHPTSALAADLPNCPPENRTVGAVGACTSLWVLRAQACGHSFDRTMARILAGAILADTEGASPAKLRDEDEQALCLLGYGSDPERQGLWRPFSAALLSEENPDRLIARDFRAFVDPRGGEYGFAILKCRESAVPSPGILREKLARLCAENRERFVLAKTAVYSEDGQSWERDRLLFVSPVPGEAERLTGELMRALPDSLRLSSDELQPGVSLSRKKLTPILGRLLAALPENAENALQTPKKVL